MTRFVMLTDEPDRLQRAYGSLPGWAVTRFGSAMEALLWERGMRGEGAFVLESRGWRYGVVFTRESRRDGWVARPRALPSSVEPTVAASLLRS